MFILILMALRPAAYMPTEHSMAYGEQRCSFWSPGGLESGVLFRLCGSRNAGGVQLLQQRLKTLLQIRGQSQEFDSHAHARVARTHDRTAVYMFLLDPEINFQSRANRHWHDHFYVAAVAADVSCIYTHWNVGAFIAQLEIEAYLVPCTTSAIGRMGTRG